MGLQLRMLERCGNLFEQASSFSLGKTCPLIGTRYAKLNRYLFL